MSAYLDERYFDWLYSQVCSVRAKSPSRTYKNLFHILYTTEFVWLVPNDDNRVEDGKYLRYEFLDHEGIRLSPSDQFWMELGCSFLEFLIALTRRLEFNTDISATTWFWKLLENINLRRLNDRVDISREDVEETLNRVIWRTYDEDGNGGLFPLDYPEQDQRKVEIWYQASAYLIEQGMV